MDRQLVYPGQIPLETDLLSVNKKAYVAMAKLAAAVLGPGPLVNGLACSPTTPASMSAVIGAGEIYALEVTDQDSYSSIAADSHNIVKQGILPDPVTLTFIAPTTSGFSMNYLIEAAFEEQDVDPITLPYYNSANPAQIYSGPNGTGMPQNTARQDTVAIQVKDGTPAVTGTQTTPAVDPGYIGLYVVTVAYGQATIIAGNIAQYSGAPFITETLTQKISMATLLGLFAGNLTANSYIKLPNGLIFEWSSWTSSGTPGNPVAVSFPNTFPHACWAVAPVASNASTTNSAAWIDSLAASGFNGRCIITGIPVYYIALGY